MVVNSLLSEVADVRVELDEHQGLVVGQKCVSGCVSRDQT